MDALAIISAEPIARDGSTPCYLQLKRRIVQLIASGSIPHDQPLPRELDLCRALGLSRATVRRCFQDLVDEGVVVRKPGQGTFIKDQRTAYADLSLNFTTRMQSIGKVPTSRILGLRKVRAHQGVERQLHLEEGTPVWEIRRVRLGDDVPMELNYVYIPCELCPDLNRDAIKQSLYAYLASVAGVLPAAVTETYEAINLDKREAELLDQPVGKAAMRILRITSDNYGKPFESSIIISCSGHAKLKVHVGVDKTSFAAIAL